MYSAETLPESCTVQLEIVSDEEVYVCNLCDEGLDSEHEVRKHLKETHKKVFELHKESIELAI